MNRPAHPSRLEQADRWLPLAGMVALLALGLATSMPAFAELMVALGLAPAAGLAKYQIPVMVDIGIVVLVAAWMSDTSAVHAAVDQAAKWGAMCLLAVSIAANALHRLTDGQPQGQFDITQISWSPNVAIVVAFSGLPSIMVVAMSVFAERRARLVLAAGHTAAAAADHDPAAAMADDGRPWPHAEAVSTVADPRGRARPAGTAELAASGTHGLVDGQPETGHHANDTAVTGADHDQVLADLIAAHTGSREDLYRQLIDRIPGINSRGTARRRVDAHHQQHTTAA